eukprot:gene10221-13751_t
MFSSLTRTFLNQPDETIIKEDPVWGFSEFPQPGDTKKHLLPILIDPETTVNAASESSSEQVVSSQLKEFWMPDRYCKVCYSCEESFTMYRRRHHCRMCGQIFCNNCSSFYIDGMLFNVAGLVRACRTCYEQLFEQNERENRLNRRKYVDKPHLEPISSDNTSVALRLASNTANHSAKMQDPQSEAFSQSNNLQARASTHLVNIVERLVRSARIIENEIMWKEMIVNLVREVVSSVDPDVRGGDSMDIRPYVKIKIIPGGSMEESSYIDGIVFRKNVSHRKMYSGGEKSNPRILIIQGGIEFQRTDAKLSSMDTLIEQEDKYMEILVDKIMSLKPVIILVGKAVARRAQELLCEHKVVVMQNVKPQLLERIGRMTGAMVLPSTDHIKQFGEECLGQCGNFWMRVIHDDPEKSSTNQPRRILKTRISRGSTYAYIQGCPSERGCSIVLRGDTRNVLAEIKKIFRFCIAVAYHLRLEVAYYLDRFADLPAGYDRQVYNDCSDEEDIIHSPPPNSPVRSVRSGASRNRHKVNLFDSEERFLLSASLDIDIRLPYAKELIGTELFHNHKGFLQKSSILDHQTLLITSLLMGEGSTQKTSAEVKGIKYYTQQDIALGKFLVDNCFHLNRTSTRESRMLDHVLSFIHRPGRIDISISRVDHSSTAALNDESNNQSTSNMSRDPLRLPLFMSSYCKKCRKIVTPVVMMSEETWKMSFGKFLEMTFYNRSARCKVGGCNHTIRDNHVLSFQCEGYVAKFDFIPIHPYALHVREGMEFPADFYNHQAYHFLKSLPDKHAVLMEDFRRVIVSLEKEVKEVLLNRHEDYPTIMSDIHSIESEIDNFSIDYLEELMATFESLSKEKGFQNQPLANEINDFKSFLNEKMISLKSSFSTITRRASTHQHNSLILAASLLLEEANQQANNNSNQAMSPIATTITAENEERMSDASLVSNTIIDPTQTVPQSIVNINTNNLQVGTSYDALEGSTVKPVVSSQAGITYEDTDRSVALHFPTYHLREAFIRAAMWNTRIDTIYKFVESVKLDQLQNAANNTNNLATNTTPDSYPTMTESYPIEEEFQTDLRKNSTAEKDKEKDNIFTMTSKEELLKDTDSSNIPSKVTPDSGLIEPSVSNMSNTHIANPNSIAGPTANTQLLSKAYTDQQQQHLQYKSLTKHIEKSTDKTFRFTKALRFLVIGGKESAPIDEQSKMYVSLGDFGSGRFGMKPGRKGEIIPVNEDEYATIIAYSLASSEYYHSLQLSLREDIEGADYDINNDYDDNNMTSQPNGNDGMSQTAWGTGENIMRDGNQHAQDDQSQTSKQLSSQSNNRNRAHGSKLESVNEAADEDQDMEYQDNEESVKVNNIVSPFKQSSLNDTSRVERAFGKSNQSAKTAFSAFNSNDLFNNNDTEKAAMPGMVNDSNLVPNLNNVNNNNDNNQFSTHDLLNETKIINSQDDIVMNESDNNLENDRLKETINNNNSNNNNNNMNNMNNKSDPLLNKSNNEKQMTSQSKSYIRHRFDDVDERGNVLCKFQCQIHWAKQFEAVRACYFNDYDPDSNNENFIRSLAMTSRWSATGGKSGAAFSKSSDDRLVVKVISRVELQMFLEFAPAYFEYMAKAYYHNLPTVLCKILGVYTIRFHNKELGKKVVENVVVMENIFYQ